MSMCSLICHSLEPFCRFHRPHLWGIIFHQPLVLLSNVLYDCPHVEAAFTLFNRNPPPDGFVRCRCTLLVRQQEWLIRTVCIVMRTRSHRNTHIPAISVGLDGLCRSSWCRVLVSSGAASSSMGVTPLALVVRSGVLSACASSASTITSSPSPRGGIASSYSFSSWLMFPI